MRTLDIAGTTWFTFTRRYASEHLAQRAYERLAREGQKQKGRLELGVYRHGTPESGMVYVTVVSHMAHGMKVAKQLLRGGTDVTMMEPEIHALILRRASVIAELHSSGAPAGSYEVRRDKPGHLWSDGAIEERQ